MMQGTDLQLFDAIKKNQYDRVKQLLEEGVPVTILKEKEEVLLDRGTCLFYALYYGDSKLIDLLH
jgi:hypothetical protein